MQTTGRAHPHESCHAAHPVRTLIEPCAEGVMNGKNCAVGLKDCARRIGMSHDHARKLVANGTFPIPELKRRPGTKSHHQYSDAAIEKYLQSDTEEVA
jgi:hypothetical protein